jgi:hypothetical protein
MCNRTIGPHSSIEIACIKGELSPKFIRPDNTI